MKRCMKCGKEQCQCAEMAAAMNRHRGPNDQDVFARTPPKTMNQGPRNGLGTFNNSPNQPKLENKLGQ